MKPKIAKTQTDMFKTLERRILQTLEDNDGLCLDNEAERTKLAGDLFDMFGRWFEDHEWMLGTE